MTADVTVRAVKDDTDKQKIGLLLSFTFFCFITGSRPKGCGTAVMLSGMTRSQETSVSVFSLFDPIQTVYMIKYKHK